MDIALTTLLSPIVLFFALGLIVALLKSQMTIPEAFAKGLAGIVSGTDLEKAIRAA